MAGSTTKDGNKTLTREYPTRETIGLSLGFSDNRPEPNLHTP